MLRVALAVAAVVVLGGCAHGGAGPDELGSRAGPAVGLQAKVTPEGLSGPDVSVTRQPSGLRGGVLGQAVELDWSSGQAVTGMIDGQPTKLEWQEAEGGLAIHGLYAGKLSHVTVTQQAIRGRMGACELDLSLEPQNYQVHLEQPTKYTGFNLCGGEFSRQAEVQLPAAFDRHPRGEQVALLSLVLGGTRPGAGDTLGSGNPDFQPPRR